jgi:hypothetical protein
MGLEYFLNGLKRRLKVLEIVKREPNGISVHLSVYTIAKFALFYIITECKKPVV